MEVLGSIEPRISKSVTTEEGERTGYKSDNGSGGVSKYRSGNNSDGRSHRAWIYDVLRGRTRELWLETIPVEITTVKGRVT